MGSKAGKGDEGYVAGKKRPPGEGGQEYTSRRGVGWGVRLMPRAMEADHGGSGPIGGGRGQEEIRGGT
jgi:hypothetical protein